MLKIFFKQNDGAAAAEFCLALLILMPLVFWMLRFGELLTIKHQTIEAARLAVWEKIYGRKDEQIQTLVEKTVKRGALFTNPSKLEVKSKLTRQSSRDDFKVLKYAGIADRLSLNDNNYHLSQVRVKGELFLGLPYSLSERYAMLGDSWNLTDRNSDGNLDNKDLEDAVNRLYFWVPIPGVGSMISDGINFLLDQADQIQNSGFVQFIVDLVGWELDINPRGRPNLDAVPEPSE